MDDHPEMETERAPGRIFQQTRSEGRFFLRHPPHDRVNMWEAESYFAGSWPVFLLKRYQPGGYEYDLKNHTRLVIGYTVNNKSIPTSERF